MPYVLLQHFPFCHYLSAPMGSVSLDSQSPTAPCESSSLATSSRGHYKPVLTIESHMGRLPRGALLSHRSAGGRWCRKAPKGGKPPEVADYRSAYHAYDIESQSRNADFISIAAEWQSATLSPSGLSPPERKRTQPFYTTRGVSRYHHPLNLLNLLNPHTEGVSTHH